MQEWFDEYAVSHQNKTNQSLHYICVPAIYFSIIGMLMSINPSFLTNTLGLENPLIRNWGTFVLVFVLLFYLRLSFSVFIKMLVFSILCVVGNHYLGSYLPLF